MPHDTLDTIVALATPPGRGALALLRLSGTRAISIIGESTRLSLDPPRARSARLCNFLNDEGNVIDRVLVTLYPAPHSFTGEDVAEISCHGSPVVARMILETCVGRGARLAAPGEFSMRAFLNGKMDLSQAEAVRDMVESQTAFQAEVARQQMEGQLSAALQPARERLIEVVSNLETALEFVEDEVEPAGRQALLGALREVDLDLEELENSFRFGRVVHDGLRVVITGVPNTGKSSIFNSLSRSEGAIVTEIPGTTRDALRERLDIEGIPVELVDTAGIREVEDPVEKIGVSRSLKHLTEADVVLFVLDETREFGSEDRRIWEAIQGRNCLLVRNKQDLKEDARLQVPIEVAERCVGEVRVSALLGWNMDGLGRAILEAGCPVSIGERERPSVTNLRHKQCLEKARRNLWEGIRAYEIGMSEEFVSYDLRNALNALGEITGETTTDEILGQIFATFCIGK